MRHRPWPRIYFVKVYSPFRFRRFSLWPKGPESPVFTYASRNWRRGLFGAFQFVLHDPFHLCFCYSYCSKVAFFLNVETRLPDFRSVVFGASELNPWRKKCFVIIFPKLRGSFRRRSDDFLLCRLIRIFYETINEGQQTLHHINRQRRP